MSKASFFSDDLVSLSGFAEEISEKSEKRALSAKSEFFKDQMNASASVGRNVQTNLYAENVNAGERQIYERGLTVFDEILVNQLGHQFRSRRLFLVEMGQTIGEDV